MDKLEVAVPLSKGFLLLREVGVGNLEKDNSLKWPHFHKLSVQTTSDALHLEVRWGIFDWEVEWVFFSEKQS